MNNLRLFFDRHKHKRWFQALCVLFGLYLLLNLPAWASHRCNGSYFCTVCTNCSRCHYCRIAGHSCRVCLHGRAGSYHVPRLPRSYP